MQAEDAIYFAKKREMRAEALQVRLNNDKKKKRKVDRLNKRSSISQKLQSIQILGSGRSGMN